MSKLFHTLSRTHRSKIQSNTLGDFKLPKITKRYLNEMELVKELTITESSSPLATYLQNTKNKQQIEVNPEIKLKRLNLSLEPPPPTGLSVLNTIETEFYSQKKKEFYIKFEKTKKEKQMEDKLQGIKDEIRRLKRQRDLLYNKSLELVDKIGAYNLNLHVLDSDDYVLYQQRQKEQLASQIERQIIDDENQKNKNYNTASPYSNNPRSILKKKHTNRHKIEAFVLSTLNSRANTVKIEQKKDINNEKNKCYDELKAISESINIIKKDIETKLEQRNKIQDDLVRYYHKLLFEGLDVRQEGLSWIIKSIWKLEANVQTTFLPNFLDDEAIQFLFTMAHKTVELKNIEDEITKEKSAMYKDIKHVIVIKSLTNNQEPGSSIKNTTVFETSISQIPTSKKPTVRARRASMIGRKEDVDHKQFKVNDVQNVFDQRDKREIEEKKQVLSDLPSVKTITYLNRKKASLESEIKALRKEQMQRMFKLFIEDDYERKNGVAAEVVISALVGEGYRDREIQNYMKIKKNYFESLQKVKFFSVCSKRDALTKLHLASFTHSINGK